MADFLNYLNEGQREAVREINGPSLIIAGAGAGKTRVLTCRVAWLLKQGIPASGILALTFTNKAAAEMKERIAKLVGYEVSKNLWIGTFHSIFAKILRMESDSTGYSPNFTIYDTIDSRNVIKGIIRELMLDEQTYKPNEVFGRISSAKNNLVTSGSYASNSSIIAEDSRNRKPRIADIYRIYQKRCHAADAMDFDDLLLNTNVLLRDFPAVLQKYQEKFRYILVDEYQDTNYAQYLIVSKLAALHKNLSVVGDDAQSIYSFRGARIENILNFRKDYPGHRIFKLEQNYRSTKTIVNAANSLILKNKGQIRKNVWSANETGEKIRVIECATDIQEGTLVAESIIDRIRNLNCDYSSFAVLYRTNAQSRIFEEALRKNKVPYKIFGSLSFYQRKEIKDLLAYFRLSVNNKDNEALFRILNYPARGIGKTTADKITGYSTQSGLTPWEIISAINKHVTSVGINRGAARKLAGFGQMIRSFSDMAGKDDAWQVAMKIASGSGILKDLFDPKSTENIAKYENIQELLNAVREFTSIQEEQGENRSLASFLQNVSLLTDADTEKPDDRNKVTLMTIHSAKGLEFGHVYIGGLEEDLFPNRFAAASQNELEEERRLFYVAITRAITSATISYAQSRYRWGVPSLCRPSRFLSEIEPQYLEFPEKVFHHNSKPSGGMSPGNRYRINQNRYVYGRKLSRLENQGSGHAAKNSPADPDASGPSDSGSGFKPGMLVEHERFGRGEIIGIEGIPPNTKAIVQFAETGRKQLLLKFARLKAVRS